MKKEVWYFYMGTNGTILSPVHLEDTYYMRHIRLMADAGKRLTKDNMTYYESITVPEEEVELWYEVEVKGQN